MGIEPTGPAGAGRVLGLPDGGAVLQFVRDHPVPVTDLWEAVTDPDRLARWIGTWTGEPRPGGTVEFRLLHEAEECPPETVIIDECEPPRRLVVTFPDQGGGEPWRLELTLTATAAGSRLLFVQRFADPSRVSDAGPGWQWYLDRLGSVVGGRPMPPAWDDFYTDEVRAAYPAPAAGPGTGSGGAT